MSPIQQYGGRRFILSVGCGAITSLLLAFGFLSDSSYTQIIIATVGAYIAGNTAQKVWARPPKGEE